MKRIVWSLFGILSAAAICSAQNTTSYFPQVADGVQAGGTVWVTAIGITNPSLGSAAVNGSITFTQDNGSGMNVTVVNEQGQLVGSGSSIPFQVGGGQTRFFSTTGIGSLNQGYAIVTANGAVTGASS